VLSLPIPLRLLLDAQLKVADDHVAQQRNGRAASDPAAAHLRERGLVDAEQGHAAALGQLEPPGVIVEGSATSTLFAFRRCKSPSR